MTELPLHTAHLVERLLARYCARICPPNARHAVELGFSVDGERATIHERRLFCGVPGAHSNVDIAQFRHDARRGEWRLYYADDAGAWHPYPGSPAQRSLVRLLREFDTDAAGVFWGRVDGKSLRWCSSRGRCAGCDERYCEILGVEADSTMRRT